MLFMYVILFLGYANFIAMFRLSRRTDKTMPDSFLMTSHVLVSLALCHAFLIGIGVFAEEGIRPPFGGFWQFTRAISDYKLCVPLFFAFGLGSALLFGYKLIGMARSGSDQSPAGWRSGLSLLAVCAGLYVGYTCVDHWYFFRGDKAGIAAVSMLGVDDVPCGDGMALVRLEDKGARWRCPKPYTLVFGARQLSNQPFLPWPGYRDGVSQKLKAKLEDIINHAQR